MFSNFTVFITIFYIISIIYTPLFIECRTTRYPMEITVGNAVKTPYTTKSPRSVMSWTPGVETRRVVIDGEEIVFRVVSGVPAQLGDVPYQVSFRKPVPGHGALHASFCGGTLITAEKVISAAHCFHHKAFCDSCCHAGRASKKTMESYYAVVGTLKTFEEPKKEDSEQGGQWRRLDYAIYPKSYDFPNYDICLVGLKSAFKINMYVSPIPYAKKSLDYTGTCLLSGFGRMSDKKTSPVLRKAELRVMSKSQCTKLHGKDMHRFICTSDKISDVGKGDSGGPLVCKGTNDPNDDGNGILAGIVSGKKMHIESGSFFTRFSAYTDYIEMEMKKTQNDASTVSHEKLFAISSLLFFLLRFIMF